MEKRPELVYERTMNNDLLLALWFAAGIALGVCAHIAYERWQYEKWPKPSPVAHCRPYVCV